jgi:hypothetical protein
VTQLQAPPRATWAPGFDPRGPSCIPQPAASADFTERLAGLLRHPVVLWAWLFAACSVTWPYLGLIHDGRLYAGQVQSRLDPELLRGDLFFEYGSQDRFSLFSTLMAPLVRAVGFDAAFFAYYVIALGLFVAGLQRVVVRLVPNSAAALVGLVFAVMAPLPYGGHNVFHVIEPFTTPRLIASALTLLGLAWTLDGRAFRAGGSLLLALAFHPLMAFPGVLIAIGYAIWRSLGGRVLGILVGVATVLTVTTFAIPLLGSKLFGYCDEAWTEGMRQFCFYQFPDAWRWNDWIMPAVVLAAGAAAAWHLRHRTGAARFVALTTAVGALGLFGTVIVMRLPYALPIMGQPYRAMWIATALMPPLLFPMLVELWRTTTPWRCAALLPLLLLSPIDGPPLAAAAVFAIAVVRIARVPEGRRLSAFLAATAIGAMILTGIWRIVGVLIYCSTLVRLFDPMIFYELFTVLAGPGLLTMSCVAIMGLAGRRLTWTSTATVLVGFAAAWLLGVFVLPRTSALESTVDPYRPGIDFVADFLKDKRESHPPQVYSSLRRLEVIWVHWRAQSYYDVSQTAGFLFTRASTLEGMRRAPLVGPFEVDYVRRRRAVLLDEVLTNAEKLGQFDASKPLEPSHIRRLASDPRLDWIVLWDLDSKEMLDLATAVGPRVAVFDAAKLRAASDDR